MTNWCEGTLKVAGIKENVNKFLSEGLRCGDIYGENPGRPVVDERYAEIVVDGKVMIEDVTRGFIDELNTLIFDYINEYNSIVFLPVRFADKVRAEELLEICKKYHIEMRIYSFESGQEFAQDIEIVGGRITRNEVIKFDNYFWDCICPDLGGRKEVSD